MIIVESREPSVFWPNRHVSALPAAGKYGEHNLWTGSLAAQQSICMIILLIRHNIVWHTVLWHQKIYHDMMLWKKHTTHIFVPKIPSNQFWHRPSFQLLMINLDKSPINWLITLWVTICYKRFFFTDFNRRFGILLVIANPKSPWFASSILGDKEPPQNLALESGDRP